MARPDAYASQRRPAAEDLRKPKAERLIETRRSRSTRRRRADVYFGLPLGSPRRSCPSCLVCLIKSFEHAVRDVSRIMLNGGRRSPRSGRQAISECPSMRTAQGTVPAGMAVVAQSACSRINLAESSGATGLINQPEPSSKPAVLTMAGTISRCQ